MSTITITNKNFLTYAKVEKEYRIDVLSKAKGWGKINLYVMDVFYSL